MSGGLGAAGRELVAAFRDMWRPLVPGTLIVVATYLLWQLAVAHQTRAVGLIVEAEMGWVKQDVERRLDVQVATAEWLAARAVDGSTAWRADADAMLRRGAPFRAVMELDTGLVLKAVVPTEARINGLLDPRDDATRNVAIRVASGTLGWHAALVTTATLLSGQSELLACAPLVRGERRVGWLVTVSRPRDLLDSALGRTVQRGYTAGVYEGVALLYGAKEWDGGRGLDFSRETFVARGPLGWRVKVWPADDTVRRLLSPTPTAVLALGMALAFCVSVSVYLWREKGARRPDSAPVRELEAQ